MQSKWIALSFEASLAAEMLGRGAVTATRANYAQHAPYFLAFFDLSVGLERSCKLAILLDYVVQNAGAFPPESEYSQFGHDLIRLISRAEEIARRLNCSQRAPDLPIHKAIIDILSEFAKNYTRYYNLELVSGALNPKATGEPVNRWRLEVIAAILSQYRKPAQLANHRATAKDAAHFAEDAEDEKSIVAHVLRQQDTRFAAPYLRMHILQIARFLGDLLGQLSHQAQTKVTQPIPDFSEFFAIFASDDRTFRRRKTWSIYIP
jgi:hypothetical protein